MGFARERVVPPAGERAWLRYGSLGLLVGVGLGWIAPLMNRWALERALLAGPSGSAVYWTLYAFSFVLLLLPFPVLMPATQRWSAVLGFAFGYAIALSFVSELQDITRRGDGGADVGDWLNADVLVEFLVIPAGTIVLAAIVLLAYRTLFVRTIELQPGMCAWCAYPRGSDAITRCPECGRAATDKRYRLNGLVSLVTNAASRWRLLLPLACAALLPFFAFTFIEKTLPSIRFYHAFPQGQRLSRSYAMGYVMPDLPAVWLPKPGLSDRGLLVTFEPQTESNVRLWPMSIEVVGTPATGLSRGAGRVVTHLDHEQAREVIEHGLPEDLVNALYAKADEIGWMPASAPRGEWNVVASLYMHKKH